MSDDEEWTTVTKKPSTQSATKQTSPPTILIRGKSTGKNFTPRQIRDLINYQGIMYAVAVKVTAKGNLAVTCANELARASLLRTKETWMARIKPFGWTRAVTPESWTRLVAHAVPKEYFTDFLAEFAACNNVQTRGIPTWLVKPTRGKEKGSVIFSVRDSDEAAYCINNPMFFSAEQIRVVPYLN